MSAEYTITNPYSNEVIAKYNFISKAEIEKIFARLNSGKKIQAALAPFKRAEILHKLAQLMRDNTEELALLITKETGKTIADSRVEMGRAATTMTCSAEEARRIYGEVMNADAFPPERNKTGHVYWKPLGLVVCITPFNFPINIASHKLGPAFAAGNVIFFKPHPQNYLSAKRFTELCYQAGIPEDVLQMGMADLPDMSELLQRVDVDCINFTGGVAAGYAISKNSYFKKLLLELGGNDPLIVMNDGNLAQAVSATINQRFATAGQRCTAAKRIYVQEGVYNQYRDLLISETKKLKVGNPFENDTFVGPVINAQAGDTVMKRIEEAVAKGATLLAGGKRHGNVIEPTILENVSDDSEIVCEETFGPVVPIRKFQKVDEILPLINNTRFGLQAGIFTDTLSVAKKVFHEMEVGALIVNDGPGFRAEHFPFGGVKDSGTGREGIRYAIEEMSNRRLFVF